MKVLFLISVIFVNQVALQQPSVSCQYFIDFMNQYTCDLTLINPNGINNFTQINGTHMTGRTNLDVLVVRGNPVSRTLIIPSIICETFSNLREIEIHDNYMQRIRN